MKIIRLILGKIILTLDALFSPVSMTRDPEAQARVDAETRSMVLYQLNACPFCVKVRRQIKRLGLKIDLKDVGTDSSAQAELMNGGKIDQVPCLKITRNDGTVEWLYESDAINTLLDSKYGQPLLLHAK